MRCLEMVGLRLYYFVYVSDLGENYGGIENERDLGFFLIFC